MNRNSIHYTLLKWFLIGFGIRAALALVMTVFAIINFETAMWYFADLPTMLFLLLAEESLPASLFTKLMGRHPYYISMNFAACLLWGAIAMLIPLIRNMVFRLRRNQESN